ncbi:MAG TPA: TonB-dependent receptor [Chitinophaga sp.]|uniref:SusC/RagA family TonB-linked outer membrane protein n=1 Tax=Chitinophaga sp. TaxID=1869181 RepID=UPI002CEAB262|nr:TonB-dependent receptor [Chitinophaga sp.]HVI43686.1 TonB-dependent receptor [Chitinophaga sp.]
MKKMLLLFFVLLPELCVCMSTESPPFTVTGKVTDANGAPLPAVSITVKGTTTGTTTDLKGQFHINVPGGDAVLVFSCIGFAKQEMNPGSNRELNIRMLPQNSSLEQVVVIGYGEVKKKDLSGSVGLVNVDNMNKAPVVSFDQALAGRVAGVQVSSTDGQPGAMMNITIRGANSLTKENAPLYVVDGFPIENNDNNAINPADIATIDILKDASATAIYGARGANGVIIITTKRGKAGPPLVTYNGYYGFQQEVKKLKVLSPYEFVKVQMEIDSARADSVYFKGQHKSLEDYRNVEGIDWYDKVSRVAPMQNHNISLSGGNGKSRYALSASYTGQDGIFVNTGFRRYQARITLDQGITDKVRFGLTANYADTKEFGTLATANGGITTASLMYSIWAYRPILNTSSASTIDYEDELFDPEVSALADYRTNPLLQLKNELRERLSGNLIANAYLEYTIINGLKLRVTGGVSRVSIQSNAFNNSLTRSGSPDNPRSQGINGSQDITTVLNFTNENTLTYDRTFNREHNLNIVGGYTQQTGKTNLFGASAIQINNESLGLSGMDEGTPQAIKAASANWGLLSFLARVNYSYRSKYLLTASIRADGSSKFPKGSRWSYFPSAAVAYRISEENFMKHQKFITDAKVRFSYGVTGNNRVGEFDYISTLSTGYTTGYSFGNAAPSRGMVSGILGNPDMRWEGTQQFNAGVDITFWKDRISFTGDYYYKRTNDLLLTADIPAVTGYTSTVKNIGSVSNSGIELSLGITNIHTRNFSWNADFNIAFNRNKVLALTQNQEALTKTTSAIYNSNPVYIAKIGKPIAQFYGIIYEGVYQYSDFNQQADGTYVLKDGIPSNGGNRASIRPGDARYRDINYDGVINLSDYTVIGDPNPDFTGGFNNNFTYKNFDLNVFFQFSYGNDVLNANRVVFENVTPASGANVNKYLSYMNRWTPEHPNNDIPRINGQGADFYTSRIVEDGSYLRLKTISLGYNIPARLLKGIKMKSIRVYASAQNLYTWTRYSGIDPEVSTRHSTLTPGFDYSPYPRARTVIFGVNASF